MKYLKGISFFLFVCFQSYSQINEYDKPAKQPVHQNTYINTYAPIDLDYLRQIQANRQALYDANYKNVVNLQKWISDLYNWSSDSTFRNDLIYYNNYLNEIKSKDLSQYTNAISGVEEGVQASVDKVKLRVYNPKIYWDLGESFYSKREYNSAIINYTKVIQLSPDFLNAYYKRALSYYSNEDFYNAINDFTHLISLNKGESNTYLYRGVCNYNINNYQAAILDLTQSINIKPTSDAYFYRALVKSRSNDIIGCIADNKKSIELDPNNSMAFNNIAWEKFNLKEYNEALTYVNRAIELDNTNSIAYDTRAEIKFYLNNYNGCIEDANSALLLNPSLNNAMLLRGRANYRLGFKKLACEDWKKSGELGNADAYEYISKYCN